MMVGQISLLKDQAVLESVAKITQMLSTKLGQWFLQLLVMTDGVYGKACHHLAYHLRPDTKENLNILVSNLLPPLSPLLDKDSHRRLCYLFIQLQSHFS